MQDLTSKFSQLYEGFLVMPVEYQVVVSAGLLIALAALKNVWGMLYPVRLAAASLLRSVAFVIHPRKKAKKEPNLFKIKVIEDQPIKTGIFSPNVAPPFELDTVSKFYAVVNYYSDSSNKEALKSLEYSQLQLLKKAVDASPITGKDDNLLTKGDKGFNKLIKKMTKRYEVIRNERRSRELDSKMRDVESKHYEPKDIPLTTPMTYTFQSNTSAPAQDGVL